MDDLCNNKYNDAMVGDVSNGNNLPVPLNVVKELVETRLDEHFAERLAQAKTIDPSYVRLWNTIHNLYSSGGKRLRPYVTLLSYQAYSDGGDITTIVPAAAAQELLHLAMLIHDDIIDRDLIRYGTANVAGQYDITYAEMIADNAERSHFSESAAILAGDLLLSDAYDLMNTSDIDAGLILRAQKVLNEAVFTVVGGELLDTESAFASHEFIQPLEIARLKTASYSFVSPLVIGATFARATEDQINLLRKFGEYVGLAYQLQDDLLGVFGNSFATGKSVKSDLSEGKYTYMVQLFFKVASENQTARFSEVFGNGDVSDDDLESTKQLLVETGAKRQIEERIDELCTLADTTINELLIGAPYKESFKQLIESLKNRSK